MTEFERCKNQLREWVAFCQGYAAGRLTYEGLASDRCFSDELEYLDDCKTAGDLVRFVLRYVPEYSGHQSMRDRWNAFRHEAYNHFFHRCMALDHPVPCDPPTLTERLRGLMLNGEPER